MGAIWKVLNLVLVSLHGLWAYQALYVSLRMATTKIERRIYPLALFQLFGVCLTALGQLRATIERHDIERGTIVATFGAGPLATPSELSVALLPLDEGRTEIVATWRAGRRGGDRRLLAAFLASLDALAAR